MQLDPTLQKILDSFPVDVSIPIDWVALRDQSRQVLPLLAGPDGLARVASVTPVNIACESRTLNVRVYRPLDPSNMTLIFVHGGGWTCGELDTVDPTVRRLCAASRATVVSCTYRLAPEHPFPAAFDDTLEAVRWALDHVQELGGDAQRVVVAGDSAGGNLVAAACIALRDEARGLAQPRPKVAAQLLLYPAVDLRESASQAESWTRDADPSLRRAAIDECLRAYLPAQDRGDWRASPLAAPDLRDLPPALVVVLSVDPLRDQGIAYAQALLAAGVPAEVMEFSHLTHGFAHFSGLVPAAARALDEVVVRLEAMSN